MTHRRFHVAIGVKDLENSITEYSNRLNSKPSLVVKNEYALFRTKELNLSIRVVPEASQGIRHLGWESPDTPGFNEEVDCNGHIWEYFDEKAQMDEILDLWPQAKP